jgi:hypothetical protein
VVTYAAPSVTENCVVATNFCAPPSGSVFSLGTTNVTCTATDVTANTNACSFTVTVSQLGATNEPPVIACNLAPTTTTNFVGDTHTITATVISNGVPVIGLGVNFRISAGPNIGTVAADTTDGNGETSFLYIGNGGSGTDTITATGQVASMTFSCEATKTWIAAGPDLMPQMDNVSVTCSNSPASGAACTLAGGLTLKNEAGPFLAGNLNLAAQCKKCPAIVKWKLTGVLTITSLGLDGIPAHGVALYLSDDATWDTGDLLLMKKPIGTATFAKAFATGKPVKLKAKVPAGRDLAGKFLLLVEDSEQRVTEFNENNNAVALGPVP